MLLTITTTRPAPGTVETREVASPTGGTLLVLENEHARVTVWPEAGGAITGYLNKATGTDYVVGPVEPGKTGYGWKDVNRATATDPRTAWAAALPYDCTFTSGEGYHAVRATLQLGPIRIDREIRLADDSPELTVAITNTNTSDQPQRLWVRWHPYMKLDDPFADHSMIVAHGSEPGTIRKHPVGSGWDHNFYTRAGYWMAVDWHTGEGLWMTFDEDRVPLLSTWTDYPRRKRSDRGTFTAELMVPPVLAQPGASQALVASYFPFAAQTPDAAIAMGQLDEEAEVAEAQQFLAQVRPNLRALGPYTMLPSQNKMDTAAAENRFFFNHRRRDRMGLRDWGFADAMLAVAGVQSEPVRLRYYVRVFDSDYEYRVVNFAVTVTDDLGHVVREKATPIAINPLENRAVDLRDEVSIADLPDGWYTFTVTATAAGEAEPMHVYRERRRLAGEAHEAMAEQRLATASAAIEERPFVTALRTVALPEVRDGVVRVPIGVEEAGGVAREAWPVRVGVPFAEGALAKDAAVRLTDPAGEAVPVQSQVTATWLDGSVKWLLIDFLAQTPAQGHVFYELAAGDVEARPADENLIQQRGDELIIDTGAARYTWSTKPGDPVLGLFSGDDLYWEAGDGTRYAFRLRGEGAGVTIESNGPLHAAVRATGWYYHGDDPQPVARGELRATFHRGHPWFELDHTVTYAGDPWRQTLGGYGARFRFPEQRGRAVAVDLDGETITAKDKLTLAQLNENHCRVTADGAESRGQRAGGAASVGDAAIYHRDFWQLHPQRIDASAEEGSIHVAYWPKAAGPMSFLPREDGWLPSSSSAEAVAVGMSRTHRFVVQPEGAARPLPDYAATFGEPVLAVVPPRYLCDTGALLHLQPYDPEVAPDLEKQLAETLESYLLQQRLWGWYGEWVYGGVPNFWRDDEHRWADYGRYAWLLNEQDVVHAPWLAYLRSGDRRYYKLALANTRHLLEVGTIRLNPVWPEYVGLSRRHHECVWLGGGDFGHSMLDPFLELYFTTGDPTGLAAAQRMASAMAGQDTGTWRYIANPLAGLTRMYLEFQDPFHKQQADRVWRELCLPEGSRWWYSDHGNRAALWYGQLNEQCKAFWVEQTTASKEMFKGLDVLSALYAQTQDPRYAAMTAEQFGRYVPGAQRPSDQRGDPLRWGIDTSTQHVLVKLREMCYAPAAVAAGRAAEGE